MKTTTNRTIDGKTEAEWDRLCAETTRVHKIDRSKYRDPMYGLVPTTFHARASAPPPASARPVVPTKGDEAVQLAFEHRHMPGLIERVMGKLHKAQAAELTAMLAAEPYPPVQRMGFAPTKTFSAPVRAR